LKKKKREQASSSQTGKFSPKSNLLDVILTYQSAWYPFFCLKFLLFAQTPMLSTYFCKQEFASHFQWPVTRALHSVSGAITKTRSCLSVTQMEKKNTGSYIYVGHLVHKHPVRTADYNLTTLLLPFCSISIPDYMLSTGVCIGMLTRLKEGQSTQHEDPITNRRRY
jgi:hypothetical protein